MQGNDSPFAVLVGRYGFLNKLLMLTDICILCVQDHKQCVTICKVIVAAYIAVVAQITHIGYIKVISIIRVICIVVSDCCRNRN